MWMGKYWRISESLGIDKSISDRGIIMIRILKRSVCFIMALLLALTGGSCTFTERTNAEAETLVVYNTAKVGIIINQAYGAGPPDDTGAVSHSFVELYNTTDTAVSIAGFSLQVQNGITSSSAASVIPPSPKGGEWEKFDFDDLHYVAPHSSFLVRILPQAHSENARYVIGEADADWVWTAENPVSNRAYSIALVNNQTQLTKRITADEMSGVVDLIGTSNDDRYDMPLNFMGSPHSGTSKQRPVRRTEFRNTGNNVADFTNFNYSSISDVLLEEIRPRWSGDGAWGESIEWVEPEKRLAFSHEAGFYDKPFMLDITTGFANGRIYYTLDGSDPTLYSQKYTAPLQIRNRTSETEGIFTHVKKHRNKTVSSDDVTKGTVVKARVIAADGTPISDIAVKSYFVGIREKYPNLPIISLSTDPDSLFGSRGLYVRYNTKKEIPMYLELLEPNGTVGVSQNMGTRMHGNTTRDFPQKSFRMYARSMHDAENPVITYDIFQGESLDIYGEVTAGHKRFILRNFGSDWAPRWHQVIYDSVMFRCTLGQSLARGLNVPYQASRITAVFLNGEFWGLYEMRSRIDEHFVAYTYHINDIENIGLHTVFEFASGPGGKHDSRMYRQMSDWFRNIPSLASAEDYAKAQTFIDIDNFIDYYIIRIYAGDMDWPHNNISVWRYRTDSYPNVIPMKGDYRDGRWRYIIRDMDYSFYYGTSPHEHAIYRLLYPGKAVFPAPFDEWGISDESTLFFRRFVTNKTFVKKFTDRFMELLGSNLSEESVLAQIDRISGTMRPVMQEQIDRWGNFRNIDEWEDNIMKLREYVYSRHAEMLRQLELLR